MHGLGIRIVVETLRGRGVAGHAAAAALVVCLAGTVCPAGPPAEKPVGEQAIAQAKELHRQGAASFHKGEYAEAERLLRRALELREGALGEVHTDTAATLAQLGILLVATRDLKQAAELLERSAAIVEKVHGRKSLVYASASNNLALVYSRSGRYGLAEKHLLDALDLFQEHLGRDHPETVDIVANLADLYVQMGQLDRAEPLLERLRTTWERSTEPADESGLASVLANLVTLHRRRGQYEEAERLALRVLEIRKRHLGGEHLLVVHHLAELAATYVAMGDDRRAEPPLRQALDLTRKNLEATAAAQSERQQLTMARDYREHLDAYLSLALRLGLEPEQVYRHVLAWKGAVFAQQRQMRALRRHPQCAPLWAELQTAARRLSTLLFASPGGAGKDRQKEIDELTRRMERLEGELARIGGEFRTERAAARRTADEIAASLPAKTALVDVLRLVRISAPSAKQGGFQRSQRLAAFVVRRDRPLVFLDLGPASPVAEAVDRWRRSFGADAEGMNAAARLRKLVWEPLEPHLDGADTIFFSPDGALGRFPLAALPGKSPGSYLLEERLVAVVPVPQLLPELLAPRDAARGLSQFSRSENGTVPLPNAAGSEGESLAFRGRAGSLLLVGDVDFGTGGLSQFSRDPGTMRSMVAHGARNGTVPFHKAPAGPAGPLRFAPLPGTARELEAIERLFRQTHAGIPVEVLRGTAATEAEFRRQAPGRQYLMLATHGFFAPAGLRSAIWQSGPPARGLELIPTADWDDTVSQRGEAGVHPGLLSGIALAGANRGPQATGQRPGEVADDGILTAVEVAELDLGSAELVVLSACETGLGEVADGEGLLGLQRAFQMAGARTVVASLWQVEDTATQQLMTAFYENLWKNRLPPAEALRRAQLMVLNGGVAGADKDAGAPAGATGTARRSRTNPRLWAAWVLSGDPGRR